MATLTNEEVGSSKYDLNAIWVMFFIICIGIVNLYSATYASQGAEAQFWKQQLMWFGVGVVTCVGAYFVHYRVLERFAYVAYGLNLLLLVGVLLVGKSALGAKRWLGVGSITIQPSEFMKITIAWTLAKYFHDDQYREYYDVKALMIPVLLVLIPVLLIMAQPDLGTKWAPRYVRVVDAMPLTGSNKVDKNPLRREQWSAGEVWWRPGRELDYRLLTAEDRQALRAEFARHERADLLS